jgi:hypothetical protein
MMKRFLHLFFSLVLLLVSLTGAHSHEHSETLAIVETSDGDSHCDLCAIKSALHSCQLPEPIKLVRSLPKSVSLETSFSSHIVFHFTLRLASRAPPRA